MNKEDNQKSDILGTKFRNVQVWNFPGYLKKDNTVLWWMVSDFLLECHLNKLIISVCQKEQEKNNMGWINKYNF